MQGFDPRSFLAGLDSVKDNFDFRTRFVRNNQPWTKAQKLRTIAIATVPAVAVIIGGCAPSAPQLPPADHCDGPLKCDIQPASLTIDTPEGCQADTDVRRFCEETFPSLEGTCTTIFTKPFGVDPDGHRQNINGIEIDLINFETDIDLDRQGDGISLNTVTRNLDINTTGSCEPVNGQPAVNFDGPPAPDLCDNDALVCTQAESSSTVLFVHAAENCTDVTVNASIAYDLNNDVTYTDPVYDENGEIVYAQSLSPESNLAVSSWEPMLGGATDVNHNHTFTQNRTEVVTQNPLQTAQELNHGVSGSNCTPLTP